MKENPLQQLHQAGQSVWLDNLTRTMLKDGSLARLIKEDGISGLTSNPAIFKKAMTSGSQYDSQMKELIASGLSVPDIYERMAITDIQGAADAFLPVYQRSGRKDGYVSLEVSPHLAEDSQGTLEEARRLWSAVDRPNLMIKIPATEECVPAIEEALFEGMNVNVTLLFSVSAYSGVIDAFYSAIKRRKEAGRELNTVTSVASFFVSRIDSKIDQKLDEIARTSSSKRSACDELRGKAAVANAKQAYQLWKKRFSEENWGVFRKDGGLLQKPLWASTSTKNPNYPDTLYVDTLVGKDTINTMPDETIAAFRDHGRVTPNRVEENADYAEKLFSALKDVGVDMKSVTDELLVEGIDKFVQPFDDLLSSLKEKKQRMTEV